MTIFGVSLDDKINDFISKDGTTLLLAIGVGALYFVCKKIGIDVAPELSSSVRFSSSTPRSKVEFVNLGPDTALNATIKTLYSSAKSSNSYFYMSEYADKMKEVIEESSNQGHNVDQAKTLAINLLNDIIKDVRSNFYKEEILDTIMEISKI